MKVYKNINTGQYLSTIIRFEDDINKKSSIEYYDVSNVEHARKYNIGISLPDYYIEVNYLTELRKLKLNKIKCITK